MARSGEHVGLPANMVDRSVSQVLGDYATQTYAVAAAEVQKLYHDPLELLTRAVQPVLWLMLFGEVMARVRGVAPGNIPYLDFLAAGILAQSALFVAIFYGISAIWERDLGVLATLSRQSRTAFSAGAGQGAFGRRAGFVTGADCLCARATSRRRHQSEPAQHPRRCCRHRTRLGIILHAVADHCVYRQDT